LTQPRLERGSTLKRWCTSVLQGYVRLTEPSASGLPNWRVLLGFPILATIAVAVMIALQISGTSSGAHWFSLGSGTDPQLLAGEPRPIRQDEWLIQQSWVVSNFHHGFAATNPMFPGGSDVTVLNELPSWDWSSLFRPHVWGYLLFGLDAGVAWHWWLPALALVIGCYVFVVSMLPKRPLMAALLAVSMYFTPLLQWWYGPSTAMPMAWALIAMAATVWVLVDPRTWVRVVWSAIVGYLAVTMAMGLYIPWIIPMLFTFLAFAVGYTLRVRPWRGATARAVVGRIAPFVIAGVAALVVTVVWAVTRLSTFDAIQSTVYPGQRSLATGDAFRNDPLLVKVAGAPWAKALQNQDSSILGSNSSEGSSAILLCLFLLPGVVWFIVRSLRRSRRTEWLLIAFLVYFAVIVAYFVVPGWDAVAHLIQFDRVAPERFRIAFAVFVPIFAVLIVDQVDRHRTRHNWIPGLLSAGTAGVVLLAVWYLIRAHDPAVLGAATDWKVVAVLLIAASGLFFVRSLATLAAGMVLVVALLIGWGVNPVYRGLFDLSETSIGNEVQAIDESDEGVWVGVGSLEVMAILMQSGVDSYSGAQNYPSDEMWSEIDPEKTYEFSWNRLGHVEWVIEPGEPRVSNPWDDAIEVTLDPCSQFAQSRVDYVLSDQEEISSSCLSLISTTTEGTMNLRVYEVTPAK
jgi:hypothetical protein